MVLQYPSYVQKVELISIFKGRSMHFVAKMNISFGEVQFDELPINMIYLIGLHDLYSILQDLRNSYLFFILIELVS